MKKILSLVLLSCCVLTASFADSWETKKGKTLEGSYVSADKKAVTLSASSGEVTVEWKDLATKSRKSLQKKALFQAAENGDVETLKLNKKWQLNFNMKDEKKNTLLHSAVKDWENYDAVKYLLNKAANTAHKNDKKLSSYDILLLDYHNWKIDAGEDFKTQEDYTKYQKLRKLLRKYKAKRSSVAKKMIKTAKPGKKILYGGVNKALLAYLKEDIRDAKGKKVDKMSLAGKYVAFYFSAHWCGPCRAFTPKLVKFRNHNKDKFEVIFVSSDSSPKSMKEYMEGAGMEWPAVKYKGSDREFLGNKFSVRGIPKLVVINPKGEVVSTSARGELSGGSLEVPSSWKK